MIFQNDDLVFNILDVHESRREDTDIYNVARNFSAVSFRLRADTYLKANGKSYHLEKNTICFVPPNIDYVRTAKFDELIAIHFDVLNYNTEQIEIFIPNNPKKLEQLFKHILMLWKSKMPGYKYKCAAVLHEIFAECYLHELNLPAPNNKIKKSINYMLLNFNDPDITIKSIAKQSFISEDYFRKLFKKEYGTSPQKYLINLRIQHAIQLMSGENFSLKEVAFMSGYKEYKYFSAEFKKIKGVSPSKYLLK